MNENWGLPLKKGKLWGFSNEIGDVPQGTTLDKEI
jgi:hypothetical protein